MVGHAEPHGAPGNVRVALLISVLAFFLAITDSLGTNAQTQSIQSNVEASNLWAFFQARTVRQTMVNTIGELAQLSEATDRVSIQEQVAKWRASALRWETDPANNDGRRELTLRAKAAEGRRDRFTAAHHLFEQSKAALELGIVLASASIVTATPILVVLAGGLGVIGVALGGLAIFAPEAVHF